MHSNHATYLKMACCRYNRGGLCKGCACVKACHFLKVCVDCRPIRLRVYQNVAGCLASAVPTNDKQQTATCVGLLLQTEEEMSQVACVNSCVPSPTLHALPNFLSSQCLVKKVYLARLDNMEYLLHLTMPTFR